MKTKSFHATDSICYQVLVESSVCYNGTVGVMSKFAKMSNNNGICLERRDINRPCWRSFSLFHDCSLSGADGLFQQDNTAQHYAAVKLNSFQECSASF